MAAATASMGERTWLDRILSLVAEVRPGESVTAVLLTLDVFILLGAYYIIKPVREALLGVRAAEIASYSGAVLAAMLLFIIPAYGKLASKVNRIRLVNGLYLFFASNLVLFFLLGRAGTPLGVAFFLWIGIFNLMAISLFWSFANDLYLPEEGKRLFAIVGIGSSVGAVAGSKAHELLVKQTGIYPLMLISAGLLLVSLLVTNLIHHREEDRARDVARRRQAEQPLSAEGGFQLVLRHRYLLYIALLIALLNFVNTNGEFVWRRTVNEAATSAVHNGTAGGLTREQVVAALYGNFQFWQNLLGALIQFFLVSRIFKYVGVRGALFIMPVISLSGYTLMAAAPVMAYIRIAKILENSTDYSLQNTTRQALFLPTSREAKYKAKQAVDSFFYRFGDMFSALAVFLGLRLLRTPAIAAVNVAAVAVWLLLAVGIAREHKKLTAQQAA